MREGKLPARLYPIASQQPPQLRCIMVWFGFAALTVVQVSMIISVIIEGQWSRFQSFDAAITLIALNILIPEGREDT